MLGIIEFLPVVVSLWCLHCLQSIKVEVKLGFPRGSVGKESACNAGDLGSIPGLGRSPGEMATHSSTLAWRIPGKKGHSRLQSMGL